VATNNIGELEKSPNSIKLDIIYNFHILLS